MGLVGFAGSLAAVTAVECFLSQRILGIYFPQWMPAWAAFLALNLAAVAIDGVYIYPRFRSPFRHVTVPDLTGYSEMKFITERPAGTTPLKWMLELPEADLLHTYSWPLIESSIFPVSPDALRDVLTVNSYDFRKPDGASQFLGRIIGFGLVTSEGAFHQRQRKALTPAFHLKNIRAFYPLMWEKVCILIDRLQNCSQRDGNVDISGWASRMTLDIIGPLALSRDFRSMSAVDEHEIVKAFEQMLEPSLEIAFYFGLHFFLPLWVVKMLPMRANRIIQRNALLLRNCCRNILAEKKAAQARGKASEEHDILQNIINTGEFTDEEIVDQMLTFLGAGHETTASALTWMVHLLTLPENQHYQKILRDEIRSAIPSSVTGELDPTSAPTYETLEALPYLNGICEETLRLFPTVPISVREAVRDTTIAGQRVPKGTCVPIVTYAINRNPRFWGPDAAVMKPERWIDTLKDGSLRFNKNGGMSSNFCETTFSHGPRGCIGRDFAKAELRCAVAGLFGRCKVSRLPGDNGEVVIGGTITTRPEGGLKVMVTPFD